MLNPEDKHRLFVGSYEQPLLKYVASLRTPFRGRARTPLRAVVVFVSKIPQEIQGPSPVRFFSYLWWHSSFAVGLTSFASFCKNPPGVTKGSVPHKLYFAV
jgi:hypothetical protein